MNKQLKWLEHYGASSAKLAQHIIMTPEEAKKIHQRLLDQGHKAAKVREFNPRGVFGMPYGISKGQNMGESTFIPSMSKATQCGYSEMQANWFKGSVGKKWKDPLAITAVAKAVGTSAIDLVKHRRMVQ